MKQNLTNTMICWNPGTDQIALVPFPDILGRGRKYEMSGGACEFAVQKKSFEVRKTIAFIEAVHIIVRDECNPLAVHKVLLGLEEYRAGCSCDMPGAAEAMRKNGEQVPDIIGNFY